MQAEADRDVRVTASAGHPQEVCAMNREDKLRPPVHVGALKGEVHWKVPDNFGWPAGGHRGELRRTLLGACNHLPVTSMVQGPGAVQVVLGWEKAGLDLHIKDHQRRVSDLLGT